MRVDRIDRLAWLVRDELTKAELEKITDQLTLFSEDMVSHELVKLQLYENQGSRIGVPRQYVKKGEFDKSSAIDCTIYGPPIDWPPFLGELHEGQFDSVQDIFDHLMSDGYGCILQAKCGCLSAGSIINVNRCGKGFKIRLDEMWNRWNVPNRYKWDRSDKTFIRSFNGECIVKNEVVDVKYSGRKLVYLVKLENGKALRATGDHKFLTTEGYIPVSKLVKYDLHVLCDELRPIMSGAKQKFSDPRVAVGVFHPYARKQTISTVIEVHRAIFEAHLNGLSLEEFLLKTRIDAGLEYVNPSEFVIHHSNGDHFDNRIENLVKLTHAEHRKVHRKDSIKNLNTLSFSKVKSVSISGVAETYDIICSDPFRNFVANGIVVHNSGKTITCLNIVGRLGLPTLVLVHKSDLMDQWEESIKKFYGLRTSQIGRIHQDTQRFKGYPITVALFQSINARQDELQAQGFFDWFSVVVIDEVQHIGARTFEMVIKLFPAKLRIGLTATPRRKDGLERVFAWHVGDIATRMKSVSVTGDFTQIRYNDPKLKYKSGDNMAKAITLLSQDVKRNILLVKWIMEASDRDRNVIVLTDRIEHATLLMGYVRLAQINGGKFASVALYVGGMKKEQLEESKKAKIIFGSYGMLCLKEDQPVHDPFTGIEKHAKNLSTKDSRLCYDISMDLFQEVKIGSDFVQNGVKSCVKIRHGLGDLSVSKDHLVMADCGNGPEWIEAGVLTTKDWLIAPRSLEVDEIDLPDLSCDDLWFLGIMIGDGCLTQVKRGCAELTSDDDEIVTESDRILRTHGMFLKKSRHQHYRTRCLWRGRHSSMNLSWLVKIVNKYGLQLKCENKLLPREFMFLPRVKILHLLAGLLDSDGYVTTDDQILGYTAKNKNLTNQVCTLFLRLGIPVSSPTYNANSKGQGCWSTRASGTYANVLGKLIPLRLPRKFNLLNRPQLKIPVSKMDSVPPWYVKKFKVALSEKDIPLWVRLPMKSPVADFLINSGFSDSWFRLNSIGSYPAMKCIQDHFELDKDLLPNVRFVPVNEIIDIGDQIVGDVSVPPLKNHLVSGVVVHNSEGTDMPDRDTLFLATPRGDVEQVVGRIQRKHEGKKPIIVFDVVDTGLGLFIGLGRKRQKMMLSMGFNERS